MKQMELLARPGCLFRKMVLFTFIKNKAVNILGAVFSLLVMPIFPLALMLNNHDEEVIGEYYMAGLFICWVIAVLQTMLLTAINLGFMHNKNASDMFFALPITRTKLFLSRLTASVFGGIISLLLATLSATLLELVVKTTVGVGSIWVFFLASAATVVMTAAVCGFFMVFSGRSFDGIAAFLLTNIGLPVLAVIALFQTTENLYGIPDNFFTADFVLGFSPFTAAGQWIYNIMNNLENLNGAANCIPFSATVWLIISVGLVIVSAFFVRKRKCESAGSSFSHFLVPIILIAIACIIAAFCFGLIFTLDYEFNLMFGIFAVVGGILCSIILGAIFDRGFKGLRKNILVGISATALYFAFLIIITSGGLGYESRVPEIDNIYSATYIIESYMPSEYTDDAASTTYTKAEDIEGLLTVHKNILKYKTLNKDGNQKITVAYRLKNGYIMRREYFFNATMDSNQTELLSRNPNRMNNIRFKTNKNLEAAELEINHSAEYENYVISLGDAKELVKAYVEDCRNGALPDNSRIFTLYSDAIYDDGLKVLGLDDELRNRNMYFRYSESFEKSMKVLERILSEGNYVLKNMDKEIDFLYSSPEQFESVS